MDDKLPFKVKSSTKAAQRDDAKPGSIGPEMYWPVCITLLVRACYGQWCSMDDYCQAPFPSLDTYPPVASEELRLAQVIAIVRHGDRTPYQQLYQDR